MAKINIVLNNKSYSIDDSVLATTTAKLKSHLSTVMNGTGSVINLGGNAYNIDTAKLETAKNTFVSHLGTIAGDGNKIVIGGVEYGIDSTKLQSAISGLGAAFEGLQNGGNGSGGEGEESKELESAPESYLWDSVYESEGDEHGQPALFDVIKAASVFGASSLNIQSLSNFLISNEDEFTSDDYAAMIATIAGLHDEIIADYTYTYFGIPAKDMTENQRYSLRNLLPTDAINAIREAQINCGRTLHIIITMDTDAEGYPVYYYQMRT